MTCREVQPLLGAYLDGELCGVRSDGTTSFSIIQATTDAGNADALIFFPARPPPHCAGVGEPDFCDVAPMTRRHHALPFGAELVPGGTRFRLWAPRAHSLALRLGDAVLPMDAEPEGWFSLTTARAGPGARYRYVVDGKAYPDPASRRQPEGVHGASEVVDPGMYAWATSGWRGRAWEEIVLYSASRYVLRDRRLRRRDGPPRSCSYA
jgi:hypothetical protein